MANKGTIPWNKGKIMNSEYCERMRVINTGENSHKYIKLEKELLLSLYWGNCYSTIEISKIIGCCVGTIERKMKENNIPFRKFSERLKNRAVPEEIRQKIKENHTYGDNHSLWRGDKVGRIALHDWVRRHKPKPKYCEICKLREPSVVHNINGNYKRDLNDFIWLCRECHMIGHHQKINDSILRKRNYNEYMRIHANIRKIKLKPLLCEKCKKDIPMDLHNVNGTYSKDVNDYKWLCRRCHMLEDGRIGKFNGVDISWRRQ